MSQSSNPLQEAFQGAALTATFYRGWLLYVVKVDPLRRTGTSHYKNCCLAPELDLCTDWQRYATAQEAMAGGRRLIDRDRALVGLLYDSPSLGG